MTRTMGEGALPAGFEELAPFVAYWVVPTSQERIARRSEASMHDIRQFYDAMMARGEELLAFFDRYPLDDLPADAATLYQLLLALAHAAMAVEVHRQPRAPNSPYPNGIRIVRTPQPFG